MHIAEKVWGGGVSESSTCANERKNVTLVDSVLPDFDEVIQDLEKDVDRNVSEQRHC